MEPAVSRRDGPAGEGEGDMTQGYSDSFEKIKDARNKLKSKVYTEKEIREIEEDLLSRFDTDYDMAEYRFRLKQVGRLNDKI